jgi:glutamate 5-kinase
MRTKLQAADLATRSGIDTIVMNGQNTDGLYDLAEGRKVGTLFVAHH